MKTCTSRISTIIPSHSKNSLISKTLIPKSLSFQKLPHFKNSLIPKTLSFQNLSHFKNSPISKTLSFRKLSHSENFIPKTPSFQILSHSKNSLLSKTPSLLSKTHSFRKLPHEPWTNGVEFVKENDARTTGPGSLEHLPNRPLALPHKLVEEFRSLDRNKICIRHVSDSLGQKRFPAARRAE